MYERARRSRSKPPREPDSEKAKSRDVAADDLRQGPLQELVGPKRAGSEGEARGE